MTVGGAIAVETFTLRLRVVTLEGKELIPWHDEKVACGARYNERLSGLWLQENAILMMNQAKGVMAAATNRRGEIRDLLDLFR